MLTLAFGMVFYTFVLKFYRLTGGDEGLPFLRPALLGWSLEAMPKADYPAGPYSGDSLARLSRRALPLRPIRLSPVRRRPSRVFGAILAAIVIFAPGGLMGLAARRRRPMRVSGA